MEDAKANNERAVYMFWLWSYTWRSPQHIEQLKQVPFCEGYGYPIGDFVVLDKADFKTSDEIVNMIVSGSITYDTPGINLNPSSIRTIAVLGPGHGYTHNDDNISVSQTQAEYATALFSIDLNAGNEQIIKDCKKALAIARTKQMIAADSPVGLIDPVLIDWVPSHFGSNSVGLRGGNIQRAVGLWIWVRVNAANGQKGIISTAIRDFSKKFDLDRLGLGQTNDTDLGFYYRMTRDCIQTAEVLSFTKRKKGTKNAE